MRWCVLLLAGIWVSKMQDEKRIKAGYSKCNNGYYEKQDGEFKHVIALIVEPKGISFKMRTDYKNSAIPLAMSVKEFNECDILKIEAWHKERLLRHVNGS